LSGKNLTDISGGALFCSSMLVTRSPDDQLLLVSICVGAALMTGLLVFAAVHCGRQKVCWSTYTAGANPTIFEFTATMPAL
jgi:hypothetical protein